MVSRSEVGGKVLGRYRDRLDVVADRHDSRHDGSRSVLLVVSAEDMDVESFLLHLNTRHNDSPAVTRIWDTYDPQLVSRWLAFHAQIHRWRIDLLHSHDEPYGTERAF